MKIVEVAFIMLIFNICCAMVGNAMDYSIYYESSVINTYAENGSLPSDISTISESQQYATATSVLNVIISSVTFNWLYKYIPDELDDDFSPLVLGLNSIMAFLASLAMIEFFFKRSGMLGESSG